MTQRPVSRGPLPDGLSPRLEVMFAGKPERRYAGRGNSSWPLWHEAGSIFMAFAHEDGRCAPEVGAGPAHPMERRATSGIGLSLGERRAGAALVAQRRERGGPGS